MDDKPFLVLDLAAVDTTLLPEVAKLTRESFDVDSVISAAGELKYIGQIKRILAAEFKNPSDELVRFLAAQVYSGRSFTQRVREQFNPLVAKATNQFINEQVNTRLKTALGGNDTAYDTAPVTEAPPTSQPIARPTDSAEPDDGADRKGEVETTDEELEGYRVIKAVVCSEVAAARVIGRDSKTYFAVLLDDNNRKPVARLWFNRSKKYLGIFDVNKVETRLPIESPEDIYQHADHLRATVAGHLAKAA